MNYSKNYFKGIKIESSVCKVFQNYYNSKNNCSTFLKQRDSKQASIDYIGRSYNKETGETIKGLAVEIRSLYMSYNELKNLNNSNIDFPISKLNEIIKFTRIGKEVFIVYKLNDEVYFISWAYYVNHNFLLEKQIISKHDGFNNEIYVLKLPLRNFIHIGKYSGL